MLARTNEDGRSVLALADVATGSERKLDLPPGYNAEATSLSGPFAPDARQLLVQHSGANTPLDVWILDFATGRSRPLTRLSLASLDPDRLPRSQIVTYASFDGTLISAVLTIPFNLRRDSSNAAVVVAHGSGDQAEDKFDRTAAALASRGYFVIRPNFRGSSGYGRAFQRANVGDLGGGDLKDTLAARDFLIATGYVDPRKVGIMGSSYGGTMTLMALARAPEAFAAGVQWFGVFNRRTQYQSANADEKQWLISMLGDPVKDKAAYDAASPASYVQNFKAPVLSLQGEKDTIVPRSQAEGLDQALRSRGIVTETIFYPGEGHGFLKIENQTDALRRTVAWFDMYLKGERPAAGR
jgi:dipeptidyl aminopeptidase/acylaminoacyl peptidase